MSSLQKFHRRTQPFGPVIKTIGSEAPVSGAGFYVGLAGDGTSYMYVAHQSTEAKRAWGSNGTARGTNSTTNGLANTNTLYGFGSAAHPSAYYCKSLTTGGYNTWYLPAINELNTIYSNKGFVGGFVGGYYWSSTEVDGNNALLLNLASGGQYGNSEPFGGYYNKNNTEFPFRAVRRSTV